MYLYSNIQYLIGGFRRLDGISLGMLNKLANLANCGVANDHMKLHIVSSDGKMSEHSTRPISY